MWNRQKDRSEIKYDSSQHCYRTTLLSLTDGLYHDIVQIDRLQDGSYLNKNGELYICKSYFQGYKLNLHLMRNIILFKIIIYDASFDTNFVYAIQLLLKKF